VNESSVDAAPRYPFARACPFDPPPQFAAARSQAPLMPVTLWNGRRAWVVVSHEAVRSILMDDARFSGRMGHPDFPTVTPARVVVDRNERAFVGMDNPDHDRYRRLFTREFSVRRMQALIPHMETLAHRLIDELVAAGPPADLMPTLAVRYPSLVVSSLFGSPYEDHPFIIDCAAARHGLKQTPEEAEVKARALAAYVGRLIDERTREPRDDMVSRVIAEHVNTGHLTRDEFAEIGAMILRAGHDTTTNMIGVGTLLLLTHDDVRAALTADPSKIEAAIEEFLRYVSPVQFSPRRVALEDVEIGGVMVKKGEGLFLSLPAANRDPSLFAQPDALDIGRDNAQHLTFGYGIHQCLGQMLARFELRVMYRAILERLPGLRLAVPLDEIRFKDDMQIYGVHNLPVTW
jgi:cytochrome P450